MDRLDRRRFTNGLLSFAAVGAFVNLSPPRFTRTIGQKTPTSPENPMMPVHYVFASDPRAKEAGYRVMPG